MPKQSVNEWDGMNPFENNGLPGRSLLTIIGVLLILFVLAVVAFAGFYIIQPGHRGVKVTLGKVDPEPLAEGAGFVIPFITEVVPISIRQLRRSLTAPCYSSDLQQVNVRLSVLFRIPESSVVRIFQEYYGEPFDALLAPRVQEALKEVTASRSAENIVKTREQVKLEALKSTRAKVGDILEIADLELEDISLSRELQAAIEAKMVQEQEAAKARFVQQRTQIEAETKIIAARGDAEAARIRGEALRANPQVLELQLLEKWDGKAPLVIGNPGTNPTSFILPLPSSR